MKKIIFLILLLNQLCFSQGKNSDLALFGKVVVESNANNLFKISLLTGKDSIIQTTFTDSNSNYVFILPKEQLKNRLLKIQTKNIPTQREVIPFQCGRTVLRPLYLMDMISLKNLNIDSISTLRKDITPSKICYELRSPCIEFKENSLDMLNCGEEKPDSVLKCLAETLSEHPEIVIEISGHADISERNQEEISLFRSEMTKNILICYGINSNRVICKGYGSKRMLYSLNEIKRQKTEQEKQSHKQQNRRIVISVIRTDFVEQKVK